METYQFDALVQRFVNSSSRRNAIVAIGGAVGALLGLRGGVAVREAGAAVCKTGSKPCKGDGECCSHRCRPNGTCTVCTKQQRCSALAPCGPDGGTCSCYIGASGKRVCVDLSGGIYCGDFPPCNSNDDCRSDAACITSCCGQGECVPRCGTAAARSAAGEARAQGGEGATHNLPLSE